MKERLSYVIYFTLGPLQFQISAVNQMSATIIRTEAMNNRVEVTDARATSVANSPNQITSTYTFVLSNKRRRGYAAFPKGQSHRNSKTVPSL